MPLMDKSIFTLEISGKDFICNSPNNEKKFLTFNFF